MEIINQSNLSNDQVGGALGCAIGCAAGCVVTTGGALAAVVLAVIALP